MSDPKQMTEGEQSLLGAVKKFEELFNEGKITVEHFKDLYWPEAWVLGPGQPTLRGIEGAVAEYTATKEQLNRLTLEECIPDLLCPDYGVTISKWNGYDKEEKLVTTVKDVTIWKKMDGHWVVYKEAYNMP